MKLDLRVWAGHHTLLGYHLVNLTCSGQMTGCENKCYSKSSVAFRTSISRSHLPQWSLPRHLLFTPIVLAPHQSQSPSCPHPLGSDIHLLPLELWLCLSLFHLNFLFRWFVVSQAQSSRSLAHPFNTPAGYLPTSAYLNSI